MAEDTYELEIPQGATLRVTFVYADENEVPQPLPPDTKAHMQVRDKPGGTLLLEADSEAIGGITLEPGGATGEVVVRVGADKTALVTKPGFYDVFLISKTDPTERELLIEGKAPLNPRITQ